MSNIFDPARAVPVDEEDDTDEISNFLDSIERKARSFKSKAIEDLFKAFVAQAKAERVALVEHAVKQCTDAMVEERTALVDAVGSAVDASCDKMCAEIGKMMDVADEEDDAPLPPAPTISPADISKISDEVAAVADSLKAEIAVIERARAADRAAIADALTAFAPKPVPPAPVPPKKTWIFTITKRDEWGRTLDVTANEQ